MAQEEKIEVDDKNEQKKSQLGDQKK